MEDVDVSLTVVRHRRNASPLEAVRQAGAAGRGAGPAARLHSESDPDTVFQQSSLVRGPAIRNEALLRRFARGEIRPGLTQGKGLASASVLSCDRAGKESGQRERGR